MVFLHHRMTGNGYAFLFMAETAHQTKTEVGMQDKRYGAYKTVQRITATPRQNEARVLTTAAIKLEKCRDNWQAEGRKAALAEALHYPQMIWSIFQTAVMAPVCPLPNELRVNVYENQRFYRQANFQGHGSPLSGGIDPESLR
jgi:flagellar biosynthesis regulator FlaF